MKRSTILLIRNAAKQDFGGAETYQVSLARLLRRNGYHPVVVTRSSKLLAYAGAHDIPCVKGWWWPRQNWSGRAALLFPAYLLWQLGLSVWYALLVVRSGAAVLHVQSRDDFIAASLAGRLFGRRVVWTDHMDLRYIFQNIARPWRNPVGKAVFRAGHLAHHIILISDNEYRLVTGCFKVNTALREQIVIVKNGVIDRRSDYQAVSSHNGFEFCLASRMVANKGIGEAIEAFVELRKSLVPDADVRLQVYGDGPELERFQAQAAGHQDIIFHGHQSEVQSKMYQADVFMLPSYQEGLSIALLEALMLGKAIIASDVDSNPEIISDGRSGLLVKPRDPAGLEQAMHRLLDDRQLCGRLARQARLEYEANFDLASIVTDKIIPLYTD